MFRLHKTVFRLAATHLVVDGYSNIYPPLLPLLIPELNLSLAAAGTLAMVFQLAASVSQLGFGHLADRWNPRWFLKVGPLVAVSILSLVGWASTPLSLAVVLVAGGLGAAAFHPPAAALVYQLSGTRKGFAMGFHISSGTLGFSIAPLLFAPFVGWMGLAWTPVLALPGLVALGGFLIRGSEMHRGPERHATGFKGLRPYATPLTLLYLIVVLRTLAALSFSTFIPVMLTRRGTGLGEAGVIASLYLLATGIGGFVGGPTADHFGARRVIALSLVLAAPFLAFAPTLTGWPFVVVVMIGGFFLQSTLPVNVTYAQAIAPVSAATVSSLMMGFAWGTGGLSVPLVGMLADRIGIEHTLSIMATLPLAAAACVLPLPKVVDRRLPPPVQSAEVGIPTAV